MPEVYSTIERGIDYIIENFTYDDMPELTLLVSINQEIIDTLVPIKLIITNGSISESNKERFFDIQFKRTSDGSEKNSLNQFYNFITNETPECLKETYWEIKTNDKKTYKSHIYMISVHLYDILPHNLIQFLTQLIKILYPNVSENTLHLMLLEDPDVIAEFYNI